ncbi:hypothetical protein [Yinghuangia soli]|uniref:Uncharacterized protein n=1 Tax=Yinghuangia soli TaxID=2908204 RepID=A0AA41PXK4_9ACTN|nr:hypothetical protein [Yinghuangia soli]MCF2527061.1 hypothetical protein [Yinghuangia soli]
MAEAVASVREEVGEDLYVFAPPEEKFFFAEGAILFVSGLVVSRFLDGLAKSRLGTDFEGWGKGAGDWIAGRFAALTRSSGSAPAPVAAGAAGAAGAGSDADADEQSAALQGDIAEQAETVLASGPPDAGEVETVRAMLEREFVARGMTRAAAARAADAAAEAATSALGIQ